MVVGTSRFGPVEIDDSTILRLPRGLIGFEDATEFCLIQHRPDTVLRWLQSTTRPELTFLVVDPFQFMPEYELGLSTAEEDYLGLRDAGDTAVLALVTVGGDGTEVTANLVGPVVINTKSLIGMQVVLENDLYSTRHPLTSWLRSGSTGTTLDRAA